MKPHPEIKYLIKNSNKVPKVNIIKNGNTCSAVNINGHPHTISNTCAFDSIVHLLGFIAISDEELKRSLENEKNNEICSMAILYCNGQLNFQFYKKRAILLKTLFKSDNLFTGTVSYTHLTLPTIYSV